MSKAQRTKEDQAHALKMLRRFCRPGDTVYTVLRHVSRSGMQRRIDVYAFRGEEKIYLSGYVASLLKMPCNSGPRDGVVVGGCGMDMGFHLVYNLGWALYPKGVPCTGSSGSTLRPTPSRRRRCMSNDHSNHGDPMHAYKKGQIHSDGGYALNQEWI